LGAGATVLGASAAKPVKARSRRAGRRLMRGRGRSPV
jgi:hypothetical protein